MTNKKRRDKGKAKNMTTENEVQSENQALEPEAPEGQEVKAEAAPEEAQQPQAEAA